MEDDDDDDDGEESDGTTTSTPTSLGNSLSARSAIRRIRVCRAISMRCSALVIFFGFAFSCSRGAGTDFDDGNGIPSRNSPDDADNVCE